MRTLLGIACGVQQWALTWAPARTHPSFQPPPLLGTDPWLVPESISPLYPPWKQRPDWLLDTVETYRRRPR